MFYTALLRLCVTAVCSFLPDIALLPFFKKVETLSKNEGSKRGNIPIANKCIAHALVDMDLWIGKGNWKLNFGKMFIDLRDLMAKYELRLAGQSVRQTALHNRAAPARTSVSALHLCITEPRRAELVIPSILMPLNTRLEESEEYETIDVNDFMIDMTSNQRRQYLLKMHAGMSCPIFSYTWARGGSRAGVKIQVILAYPLTSK